MAKITIDGKVFEAPEGIPLIQACELAGVEIPRFCYHDKLRIAGNCRMCLVEVEKSPKPVASCIAVVKDGMVIKTKSEMVNKAREGVMEFLLINHPLDCPICDLGGECDLQDQAFKYGKGSSRFHENKRSVKDKYMGPLIKTHMTRCIHCTRCVRFMSDIAGVDELGAIGRGEDTEITTYLEKGLNSELSGNIIDLCPVGALNSKPYSNTARSWELSSSPSIDVFDAMGSNIRVDARGLEVMRILPIVNEDINEEWISDKIRFSFDGLKLQRIDKVYAKIDGKLKPSSWEDGLSKICYHLTGWSGIHEASDTNEVKAPKIGAIAGDMTDCQTMLAAKILLEALGSRNYDFNQYGYNFDYSSRGNYLFNSSYAALEEADLILLIGADVKKKAPVLGARIGKLVRFNNLKVARIGEQTNQAYAIKELGENIETINELLSGKHEFSDELKNFKKPVMIIGDAVYTRKDSIKLLEMLQELATKNRFITEDWNGFSVLLNEASTAGAIDLGFHPEGNLSEKSQAETAKKGLQSNISKLEKGLSAPNMVDKISTGELDVLFLLGADDINIPYDHKGFIVYIGHHGDKNANIADIVLPATAFTEKEGLFLNNEGRLQKTKRAVRPLNKAMSDCKIILEIARMAGIDLGFRDEEEISSYIYQKYGNFVPMKEKVNFENTNDITINNSNNKLAELNYNFYTSNSISRASKTMAECVKEFYNNKKI